MSERTKEMAQRVKPLADKSDVLRSIPGLHMVECETGCIHTHTHNLRKGRGREEEREREYREQSNGRRMRPFIKCPH